MTNKNPFGFDARAWNAKARQANGNSHKPKAVFSNKPVKRWSATTHCVFCAFPKADCKCKPQ